MKIHDQETDHTGVLSEDGKEGREDQQANDLTGAAGYNARRKASKRTKTEAMIGCTFGRLTAIEICKGDFKGKIKIKCLCKCGRERVVEAYNLRSGNSKSCGCSLAEDRQPPIFHEDGSISFPLTQGKFTRIDGEDFERVSQFAWHFADGYARRGLPNGGLERMQAFILQPPPGFIADHRHGDTLDNRKSQLRLATEMQNRQNKTMHRNNTSGFKGVSFQKGKWKATIRANGEFIYLGFFTDINDAAAAYAEAAKRLHGEFARLA